MLLRKKQNGFTLIELLIVIVILGLLASLVAPEMFGKIDSSGRKTAKAQMSMLETSLDTFRLDTGNYPKALNELIKSDQKNWDGPYLPKDIPLDPWGNPYVYTSPGENGKPYTLMSYGKDGVAGGTDNNEDIVHQ
jgi:general secretion pathway protein G